MINLRYHIVSITAVFLALGIGIAMGSSFLSDAAIDQVDRNIESTREEARAAREEAAEAREELALQDERNDELLDQGPDVMYRDSLDEVPIVVLTVGGVDRDSLDRVRDSLTASRADFEGTLTVTDRVQAIGDDADAIAEILGLEEGASPVAVRAGLVEGVAAELAAAGLDVPLTTDDDESTTTEPEAGGDPDEPSSPDLIRALVEADALEYEPAPGGTPIDSAFEEPGHRYVIVTGPEVDITDESFLLPLLTELTADGPAPVVVASAPSGEDPEATRDTALEPILLDDVVGSRVTTVNSLDAMSGTSAVLIGLDDLARGRLGHYGFGDGAESQLPPP